MNCAGKSADAKELTFGNVIFFCLKYLVKSEISLTPFKERLDSYLAFLAQNDSKLHVSYLIKENLCIQWLTDSVIISSSSRKH